MIGRKIPIAKYPGRKKVTVDEDQKDEADEDVITRVYKKSIRVVRQETRAKRARKRRNGWMFGRKIKVGLQLYPVYALPVFKTIEPEVVTVCDEEGHEYTYRVFDCTMRRREKPFVDKDYDPSYDDVFKFFGDIDDYDISEVVFTVCNEPGSIPLSEKLSFIPPSGSNVTEVTKKKKKEKAKKKEKEKEKKKKRKEKGDAKRSPARPFTCKVGKAKLSPASFVNLTVFIRGALFVWRSLWFLMTVRRVRGSQPCILRGSVLFL